MQTAAKQKSPKVSSSVKGGGGVEINVPQDNEDNIKIMRV